MLDIKGFVLEAALPRALVVVVVGGGRPSQGSSKICRLSELLRTLCKGTRAPRSARSPSRCLHVLPSLPKMKVVTQNLGTRL